MAEYISVPVPALGVNDDTATIVEYVAQEGQTVTKGAVIVVLETTKSTFDVEAPADGVLVALGSAGNEVSAQTGVVALIVPESVDIATVKQNYLAGNETKAVAITLTRKAEKIAEALGVTQEQLEQHFSGIVRERDVEDLARKLEQDTPSTTEEPFVGQLDAEFVQRLIRDKEFQNLTSGEKIAAYQQHGAVIEDGVSIGTGSVIVAEYVHLKQDARVGDDCYIRTQQCVIGRMSVVGNHANMVVGKLRIGDVCVFGHSVMVTGGFGGHSALVMGNRSLVSGGCLLDAGDGITIGNEVGISPFVKLYTHNHWQSELEGYHSNFGPITVEDKAYITGDCLVVPGVTIGKGATVMANSTVTASVRPFTQVSGNPARVVGKIDPQLSLEQKDRIAARIVREMVQYFRDSGLADPEQVVYCRALSSAENQPGMYVLTFEVGNVEAVQCVVFDLTNLTIHGTEDQTTDEIRNFLRRRGIRFQPMYWRYMRERHLYQD
jgi:acetyltransferase-like isoleucine patch superfamily enzyme